MWPKDSYFTCFEIYLKNRYDSTDWTAAPSQGIRKEHYKCRHNFYPELESVLPSEQIKATNTSSVWYSLGFPKRVPK